MRHPRLLSRTPLSCMLMASVLMLSGCFGGSSGGTSSSSSTGGGAARVEPSTRYEAANGCYGVRLAGSGRYLTRQTDGSFQFTGATPASLPIYFKPTALGRYMLSLPDGQLLAAGGSQLTTAADGSDAADWVLDGPAGGPWTLTSVGQKTAVVADAAGKAALGMPAAGLGLSPAAGCKAFPEITTNADGDTFSGTLDDGSVLGFADAHVHISATEFLGGAHYGSPFHRFGVAHALGDCKDKHGQDGREDLVGNLYAGTPQATHDTQGWPTFASWPAAHSLTHESMYYKWVERAWKAGLRLMVNELVENEVLCTINSTAKLKPQNCNEMNTVYTQVQTMHDLQDYIDAQSGGPGKGWFRLVTSPAEARQVITQGKLAVVLGVEVSHVLNCNVKYNPDGSEQRGCTQASVDAELDKLYNAGIRQLFPVHEFDNALGGNGIFNGLILNGGNFIDTGRFWSTYDCPDVPYYYGAGAFMQTVSNPTGPGPGLFDGSDPLSTAARQYLGGALPVYKSDKLQCNARKSTDLGRYAIGRMMDKGMVIDLDHLELAMKTEVIDLAAQRTKGQLSGYPLTSTHGGHGGITMDQAKRVFALGGLIYDYKHNGKDYASEYKKAKERHDASGNTGLFAFGYGADTNGMGAQADPRPAGRPPVTYPFTLFSGSDWDPALFSKVKPLVFQQQVSGERRFSTDKEGMAHYGLVADWVEEVRLEGGKDALSALYRSAEVYLRMWERARTFAGLN